MSAHEEESMRSTMKKFGIAAFVVAFSTLLAACASSTPASYDASKVSCGTVAHDVSLAKTSLSDAKSSVKESKGTPGEASAQANVDSAQVKLNALNKRATKCNVATGTLTKDEQNALIKAFTITTVSASAVCKTDGETSDGRKYVTPEIGSFQGTPPRLWPASISTAIAATDTVGARAELQQAICKDPLLGTAWLTFVATTVRNELLATTGMDLLELNPRLKAYTDISRIKAEAKAFLPTLNVAKLTAADLDKAVTKNVDWQQDAALVNTLLEKFAATGIEARQSTVNYELFNYATATDLSDVREAKDQENLPALIFAITVKGQCGELMAFGANVGDKRPELFKPVTCAPPTTTTPSCVSTATHKCTSTPGCTSNCGPSICTGTSCNPCPPGNTIPDCAPKSHNPSDYTYPSGKPKATVTTPPESSPPAVTTTTPTGGGGVTDSSTKAPGSETGTTAPGATAPSTAPSTAPVNEGGDN
jgi:hypothetical protein